MLVLGLVSSFRPQSMCKREERVTAKTGCCSCTNRTLSFEVSGFQTKTHLLQKALHFFKLITTLDFCAFIMHHSKPRRQLSTLCAFICYFHAFSDLFWAKWPWNWKALQMNYEKVKTWHGVIISPHGMCKKVEWVMAKTGCNSCTKWTVSFKVSGSRTKTHLLHRYSIF